MRTTIEMSDAHRATLLRLATERGEKGFSRLVAEAMDAHAAGLGVANRAGALRIRGTLSEREAEVFRERVKKIRENWH